MGKIIPLFDHCEISFNELANAINDNETKTCTQQELDRLTHYNESVCQRNNSVRKHIEVNNLKIIKVNESGPFGEFKQLSIDGLVVGTHENFPNAVRNEDSTISRSEALGIAAVSICAFGSIQNWLSRLAPYQRETIGCTSATQTLALQYPKLWSEKVGVHNIAGQYRQHKNVLIHRAAARVALNVYNVSDYDPSTRNLPAHIAALADPLNDKQVFWFYSASLL